MFTYRISKNEVSLSNDFNRLTLGSLSPSQLNILMVVAIEIRIKDSSDLSLPAIYVRGIAQLKHAKTNDRLKSIIDDMHDKLTKNVGHYEGNRFVSDILFDSFNYDLQSSSLIVKVNADYKYIFTEHTTNFTKFELDKYCQLRSKYTKNLYRLCMQYNHNNKWAIFRIDQLRQLLGCPDNYSNSEFLKEIVRPVLNELNTIMDDIRVEKNILRKRGAPVSTIKFMWFSNSKVSKNAEKSINTPSASVAGDIENELPF